MANPNDDFFAAKPFPVAPPTASEPRPTGAPRGKPRSVVGTYVLPVALFVAIVGGIAYLTQNVTGKRSGDTPAPIAKSADAPMVLAFDRTKAIWEETRLDEKGDPLDPYVLEWEKGDTGHYDFPFRNKTDQPAEVGFLRPSCDCTSMQALILDADQSAKVKKAQVDTPFAAKLVSDDAPWTEMKVDEKAGVVVPPKAEGILRMTWNGRKEPGSRLRLSVFMWIQPQGNFSQRQIVNLEVPIIVSPPAVLHTETINVGAINPKGKAEASVLIWSPTRESFTLKCDNADPLTDVTFRPLPPAECKAVENDFRQNKRTTRVRSAYVMKVVLHEERDGKQMDLGPFRKTLPLQIENAAVDIQKPTFAGIVRGDVEVGSADDRGRINLKTFRSVDGARASTPVWTETKVALEIAMVSPTFLETKLTKPKDDSAARPRWTLELAVPPGKWVGSFGDDAVITLKIATDPPRFVRIPISGTSTGR